MTATAPLERSTLPFPVLRQGKVREVYDVGEERLLIVASDRISAFDVVMAQPIPRKGEVLTQITAWWLERVGDLVPNHLIAADPDRIARALPVLEDSRAQWGRRSMLVRRTEPLPVECVVRGYLAGSAWKEYREAGTLAGEPLPEGLVESDALPEPIFSPATKAETGHDQNITFDTVRDRLGAETAEALRETSLALYRVGRARAEEAGIILADTKFEFGRDADGSLVLIDEVLTPDSSRFWPREHYGPGRPQPSLDKQPVRDYLEGLTQRGEWDKRPPPPALPAVVVAATSARYLDVFERLTGVPLDRFTPADQAAPEPDPGG